jgi:hypothetical protein
VSGSSPEKSFAGGRLEARGKVKTRTRQQSAGRLATPCLFPCQRAIHRQPVYFTSTLLKSLDAGSCNQNLDLSPTTTMTTNGKVITCATPDFSKRERFGVLFGHPIAHSYSPMMHQTVYDNIGYDWQQFLLESTDMSQFLALRQHPQFYG